MRNNNPGNIRHSNGRWLGQSEIQLDPAFVTFDNMSYGVRALGKLLQTYQSKYKLNTVTQIIGRWAPPNENNTAAYVKAVQAVMPNPTGIVNTKTPTDLTDLIVGIVAHENGIPPAGVRYTLGTALDAGVALIFA